MGRIEAIAVCWLGVIAGGALTALTVLSLQHATPDPAVLVAFTGALASPVGAIAGMVTMQHIGGNVLQFQPKGDTNVAPPDPAPPAPPAPQEV